MDIANDLNKAVDYIEHNLDSDIDIQKAASIAGCSIYHFTRMFAYLAGVSISKYIKNRRLAKAGYELRHSSIKIIDLSYKYGYLSPTSFTRAFYELHAITPTQARCEGASLKAYLPITFQISIKGVTTMDYKIVNKDGFRAVGIRQSFSTINGENFEKIPKMWEKVMAASTFRNLMTLNDIEPKGSLGICANMDGTTFDYWIAVPSAADLTDGLEEIIIKPQQYAVFPCKLEDIQSVTKQIYSQWLPASNYSHSNVPEIEYYYDDECVMVEIWVPVKEG